MKRFHANVGSRNPALQQRPEVLHAVGVYAAIYVLNGMVDYLMRIVGFQSVVSYPLIAIERGASLHMLSDFWLHAFPLAIRHNLCADTSATFQHPKHDGFVRSASSSNALFALTEVHVSRLPADEGLINFDFSAELGTEEIILHCKANAMQHEPCRLLGDLHVTRNLVTAHAVLAVRNHPSCGHPLVEWNSRIFHDGPDLHRELSFRMVRAALPDAPRRIEFHFIRSASRAKYLAIGPATDRQIVDAVIRIREVDDCFLKAFRFTHGDVLHARTLAN